MSPQKTHLILKDWIKPIATSLAGTLMTAICVFIAITFPTLKANVDSMTKKVDDIFSYQRANDKVMIEALVKQGVLETRLNDLERQLNYQNYTNKNLKP